MSLYYYLSQLEQRVANYRLRTAHATHRALAADLLQHGINNTMQEILFVCTGNICRSAYAEHALKAVIAQASIEGVSVHSAGIATTPGKPADTTAKKIALEREVDLRAHRTSFIYRDGLQRASLILIMEPVHQRRILSIEPSVSHKILYTGLLGTAEDPAVIADPFGRSEDSFRACFDSLDRCVATVLNLIGTSRKQ